MEEANIKLEFKTFSSDDSFRLGQRLGAKCRGGELFLLSSDLGGGKTTLTKGLAKGLGCADVVTSPTFTISNIYNCRDDISIHHYDFYRLNEAGVMELELNEVLNDPKAVIVIEWGGAVHDSLPVEKISVIISRVKSGEDHRQIELSLPDKYRYLVEDL